MRAQVLSPTPDHLALAAHALQRGEIGGMPTETVYGLAGSCRSEQALSRIFSAKQRPTTDPLIVHVNLLQRTLGELSDLKLIELTQISNTQRADLERLIDRFWPGPLTFVLPKHSEVHPLITGGLETVAIRMPRHPIARQLITAAGVPLAAPSANRFGRISPTTAEAVLEELGMEIDWILQGGPSDIGLESTVLAWTEAGELEVLRPGGISQEEIQSCLGRPIPSLFQKKPPSLGPQNQALPSPGMLESHYAPAKPFYVLPAALLSMKESERQELRTLLSQTPREETLGLLLFQGDTALLTSVFEKITGHPVLARNLSIRGDTEEAARLLYAEMRFLDTSSASLLFTEPPAHLDGLGSAIADRLKRATAKAARNSKLW